MDGQGNSNSQENFHSSPVTPVEFLKDVLLCVSKRASTCLLKDQGAQNYSKYAVALSLIISGRNMPELKNYIVVKPIKCRR